MKSGGRGGRGGRCAPHRIKFGHGGAPPLTQDLAPRAILNRAEARRAVEHEPEPLRVLGRRAAIVPLPGANPARAALGCVERDAEVARGERGDALADALDDAAAFVAEDDGKAGAVRAGGRVAARVRTRLAPVRVAAQAQGRGGTLSIGMATSRAHRHRFRFWSTALSAL